MNTNGVVLLTKSRASSRASAESVNKYCIFGHVTGVEMLNSVKLQCESKKIIQVRKLCVKGFPIMGYFQVKIIEILLAVDLTLI